MGFKNFPMDNFGVISPKLKKLAKTPDVPEIVASNYSLSGKILDWQDCKIKNIESLGEQSAAGLSAISGVLIVNIKTSSKLAKEGVKTGDVIIECNQKEVKNMNQLLQIISQDEDSKVELVLIQNQKKKSILVDLK
jgi:S1-C subfamily serine protease